MAASSSSSSSFFPDFGLLLYLQELNKDEFKKFKLLLKEDLELEHHHVPWSEVKKANREDLANLMKDHYPGEKSWSVTLKLFGKMNLKDLCKKAKAEMSSQTTGPEDTKDKEVQQDQEAVLEGGIEYRIQIKKKFGTMKDQNNLFGDNTSFCGEIFQRFQELMNQLFDVDPQTGKPHVTVVLHGPAGIGKTFLMRKVMLDWAEGNLYQQKFLYVFYLNAREINQLKEVSFVQLISKDWPMGEGAIERILFQPKNLLFIVDSFHELNFAFEEPEIELSNNWTLEQPVSFLMSSLLRRVMLPESSLLVTTRSTAYKKLRSLLKTHVSIHLLGMPENEMHEYISQVCASKDWGINALAAIRNNEILLNMCQVPLVCRIICTALTQKMEKGVNVTLTCQTTTSLFTCFFGSLLTPADGSCPSLPGQIPLKNMCHLAAMGIWNMTYVFYKDNLKRHGLKPSDISVFLDTNIFQKDSAYSDCYVFAHLHVQEFFAAMFYMLQGSWETMKYSFQSFENLKELLESKTYENTHLMQMKYFLFGLLNEQIVKQLENIFNCTMSLELIKWDFLHWVETLGNNLCPPPQSRFLELFHCLFETQDKEFIIQAMSHFQNIVINICGKTDLLLSSFCLKHCNSLLKIKITVTVAFEKMLDFKPRDSIWRLDHDHITHCWQDLFSMLHRNRYLKELDLFQSHLDALAVMSLYRELQHPDCRLQRLLLRSVSFPDGCKSLFRSLTENQNLMHLDLKKSDINYTGVRSLCRALKHPNCKLQSLSLEGCGLMVASSVDLSSVLIQSKSLKHLSLADNALGDSGVERISLGLKHPRCILQRLILTDCSLTSACCPDLASVLSNNSKLSLLDLGKNDLQDDGVKILCEALKHPGCHIQSLGLGDCGLTSLCCDALSSALSTNPRLTNINLIQNTLGSEGIKKLYEVLKYPECTLQILGLSKETFDEEAQKLLAAVEVSNPSLLIKSTWNYQAEDES